MPKKKPATPDEPTFEQAISQLETIVRNMDEGELGLEESLEHFETGTRLLRYCHHILQTAEQKIEQLTGFDETGNEVCQPFDATATIDQREQTAGRRNAEAVSDKDLKKRQLFTDEL